MSRERAEELFRAARDERPEAGLAERILAHTEATRTNEAPPLRASGVEAARSLARVKWLLVAALLVPAFAFVASRAIRSSPPIALTAEPLRSSGEAPARPAPRHTTITPPARAPEASQDTTGPREVPAAPLRAKMPARKPQPAPTLPPARTSALPNASRPTSSGATPGGNAPLSLSNELGVLKQARAVLRGGDGAAALALLNRYESESNTNGLQAEGTLLRIEALVAVGQRSEAETLARRFIAEHPHSPLTERARTFLRPPQNP